MSDAAPSDGEFHTGAESLFIPADVLPAGRGVADPTVGSGSAEVWMPTEYSRGPWSPDALHGGPVAALLVRAAQRVEAPIPVRLVRITVELLRPVPLVPLVVDTTILRPGKKVSTLELTLSSAEVDPSTISESPGEHPGVFAVARVQRVRSAEVEFPDGAVDQPPTFPAEASPIDHWPGAAEVTFHADAVEHRFVFGNFSEEGPSLDWMRLKVRVVPNEEPTGWQRAAALADFTNGLSSVAPFDGRSVFINPDLTVNLWREPEGEWICNYAETRTSDTGVGLAQGMLWDRQGRCGVALQSLYLDR